jgi:hypothetical protein
MRMSLHGPYLGQVLPAPCTLFVCGFLHGGSERVSAFDVQLTEDEELVEGVGIVPDFVGEAFSWQG